MLIEKYKMENQLTILISTIAAAISAIFAAVSSIMTYSQYRKEKLQKLNDRLDEILKIGVQYPYVENANFISQWVNNICDMICIAIYFLIIWLQCTTIIMEIKTK